MEELVARIAGVTGLDAATVEKAITHILAFLTKEGPSEQVNELLNAIPGAQQALAGTAEPTGASAGFGGMMGMMGGGVMALGQKLMAEGLSMDQMRTLGGELFAYGREKAGEDVMGPIIASIPGLSQFV